MRTVISVPVDGVVRPAEPNDRTASVPRGLAWFLPDVACLAAFVTLFYCCFLFDGYTKLFRDSDTGWHIRTGESILATGTLPRTDPYSFTRAGHPWFAWEWGSDVLMGLAHRAGGLSAVAMLYSLAIASGVWLWFRLHWAVGGNFLLACALAAPMLSTSNIHWLARPHVLSWLFLLSAVLYAEKVTGVLRARHVWIIVVASALWANLHASFFFAPLIAWTYALGYLLRPWIWELDTGVEWSKARWFLSAGGIAGLASLINPYGWQLHRHVLTYLGDTDLLSRIGEFQSFNFHAEGAFQILLTLGVASLGAAAALAQKRLPHFFLAVLLIASALRSARALPLVALLLLPLANSAFTKALSSCSDLRPAVRGRVDRFLRYSERLRALDSGLSGLATVPILLLVVLGLAPAFVTRAGFPSDQFPEAALPRIEKLPQDARLLAPDKFGGFLIFHFHGRRKVFFDGRSDLYGSEFLKQYARLVQVRPGWQEQLEALQFTHALLPNDYSLIPALEQLGWKRLYRDEVATLLAKI